MNTSYGGHRKERRHELEPANVTPVFHKLNELPVYLIYNFASKIREAYKMRFICFVTLGLLSLAPGSGLAAPVVHTTAAPPQESVSAALAARQDA